ncbi:MAG: hypothetical protein QXZ11_05495 [Thermoproteota archaeon]
MEGEIPDLISGTQIHVVGKDPVVSFAAEELSRYLQPSIKKARIDGFNIVETASYDHRGVCIEGAVTPEMVMIS